MMKDMMQLNQMRQQAAMMGGGGMGGMGMGMGGGGGMRPRMMQQQPFFGGAGGQLVGQPQSIMMNPFAMQAMM